jgi:hypothetical protein
MISEHFFAYRTNIRNLLLLKCELLGLFYMAHAAEHALNTPFFAWLVLVTPKLFTAYSAINYLFFSKEVQVNLIHASAHTKMYIFLLVHEALTLATYDVETVLYSICYLSNSGMHQKVLIFCYNQKIHKKSNAF